MSKFGQINIAAASKEDTQLLLFRGDVYKFRQLYLTDLILQHN